MAAQTITGTTTNFDASTMLGLTNGDAIVINGGTLVINSDSRWGQNAAVFASLTPSATLGGNILLDGRDVWWIPYTGGTGNVPALGTVGVNDVTGSGGGAGEFLGVFTGLGVAPSTAGSAMPSTGFIKLRKKTSNFVNGGTMTFTGGATAVVNSSTGGVRGWINVVAAELNTMDVARLNSFQCIGDWFELGTTNGADDQTFQFPVADAPAAIQIETAVGSGVYEWWLNGGGRWGTATPFIPTDVRGKYFGCVQTTGVITIARRSSNSCGYKPVSGLRVRIPNVICSSSNATNYAINTMSTTISTRPEFRTSSGGYIDIQNMCGNWYLNFATIYYFSIKDSAIAGSLNTSNPTTPFVINNCAFGYTDSTEYDPIVIASGLKGGEITDVRAVRYSSQSNAQAINMADCYGVNLTRVKGEIFGSNTTSIRFSTSAASFFLTRCNSFTALDCAAIGARFLLTTCLDVTVKNLQYADQIYGDTQTTVAQYAINLTSGCRNIIVDGFSWYAGLTNQQAYNGILQHVTGSSVTLKNVATAAAPLDMGTVNAGGSVLSLNGIDGLKVIRVYIKNMRLTNPILYASFCLNVLVQNFWVDAAAVTIYTGTDVIVKGTYGTPTTSGQLQTYGFHAQDYFNSSTTGGVQFALNEASSLTASQVSIVAGTPKFTATGRLAMPTLGDQAIVEMAYFALGHTAFQNVAPTITAANPTNMSYEYQIDTGSGWNGTWKTLSAANLSAESITYTTGFKLKVRITTTTANSSNTVTFINIPTTTNSTAQQIQYPLPNDATGTISNLVVGSRVQLYNVTTSTELFNEIATSATRTYSYLNGSGISAGDTLRLRVTYQSGAVAYLPYTANALATSSGFSFFASQLSDTIYNANAIDGSTVTELSADYPNVQIDSSDIDGGTTVQRIYAWFVYNQTTSTGIQSMFAALLAEDLVNYKIITSLVNLRVDNVISTPLQITGGRLYRDDGATIIASTSNSIQLDPNKAYYITGSGGGGATAADIWSYGTRSLTSATVVRTELATELARLDAAISTRLASAGYTAPDNVGVAAIKAKTDNLPADPASNTQVATRLASSSYTAPDNAGIAAIKTQTDKFSFTGANVNSIAQVVSDKTGYALSSAERTAVAIAIEAALLNELDGQAVLQAIVNAIGNTNIDQIALVAAIRADIERAGGAVQKIKTNTDLIPATI